MALPVHEIKLPRPKLTGARALERVLHTRRSIREFSRRPLSLPELAQLLWSCQGITSKDGLRATPSAGATYPLEIYAAVENVKGLTPGVYHYVPGPKVHQHCLELVAEESVGAKLCQYSSTQEFIRSVPLNIIFCAFEERTRKEYGAASRKYVLLEIGHAAQNLHLQAEALGLGSVAIGYLDPKKVRPLLRTSAQPHYMVSIGRKCRSKGK
jgi:SagB-type dehydrogenase family enzyme